jgi:hypothetical protein
VEKSPFAKESRSDDMAQCFLTVSISLGQQLHLHGKSNFCTIFLYSLLRPKELQIRKEKKFAQHARAPSNFIVVKYSKCSGAGF